MKIKSILILLSLVLLFSTCSEKSNDSKSNNNENALFIDLTELPKGLENLTKDIKEIKFVPLETSSECYISVIKTIIENENYIFVRDNRGKSILRFDKKGKYISKIEKIGKGPGEYLKINGFSLIPKTQELLILDFNFNKLLRFNYEGEYISKIPIKNTPFGIVALSKEIIACYFGRMKSFNMHDDLNQLYYYDFEGNMTSSYFPLNSTYSFGMYTQGFANPNPYESNLLINSFDYNIYEIKDDLSPKVLVQLDFGKFNVDTSYYLVDDSREYTKRYFETTDKIKTLHQAVGNKSHISVGIPIHISIGTPMENDRFVLVINRNNHQNKLLFRDSLRNCFDFNGLSIPEPTSSYDNYFIAYYSSIDFMDKINKMTEKELAILRKNISGFEECEKLSADDNPILVYYSFK